MSEKKHNERGAGRKRDREHVCRRFVVLTGRADSAEFDFEDLAREAVNILHDRARPITERAIAGEMLRIYADIEVATALLDKD